MNIARLKAQVRQRDGMRCRQCGMTSDAHRERYGRQLDVHRVVPGSHYTLEGCVALCRRCHGPQPRRQRGQVDLTRNMVALRPAAYRLLHDYARLQRRPASWELHRILLDHLLAAGQINQDQYDAIWADVAR